MCGIVGVQDLSGSAVDVPRVRQAASLMRHRGPDGEGYLLLNTASGDYSLRNGPDTPPNIPHPLIDAPVDFSPDLVLGHRRLAIIDLSPTGHEPMSAQQGRLWLTFNGEIYNYLELRDELRAKGYQFETECDAEVILQAYDAWGIDCLERFVGMFAFALWDQSRRRLWCVRDRFGVKPFYYVTTSQQFAFASEIKALVPLASDACHPDMAQLFWFLHYGNVYNAPRTFFEGVQELPGGHYLLIEAGRVSDPIRYWDVNLERARATYNYADPQGELLRLLRDSIRLRLRSDVPVGTCLSGGLDSSAIIALATEQLDSGRMNSFSALYPVRGLDESRYVDIVAKRFNTIGHAVTPGPDNLIDQLAKITWHQDIPTAGPGVYTQNAVMRLAQGTVTVLLDGQGSDELFAGYQSYIVDHLRHLRARKPLRWARESLIFSANVWARFNSTLNWREFSATAYRFATNTRRPPSILKPEYEAIAQQRRRERPTFDLAGADPVNKILYQAVMRDRVPAFLHYEDRNSMAYGIESRVPFLDHRLVEFALGVPSDLKIRGAETKWFMRQALRGILPNEIVNRKDKLGFPTPFSEWLRGPLRSEVNAYLNDKVLKRDWYDRALVRRAWADHSAGRRKLDWLIYRLITAEHWLDQHEIHPISD